MAKFTPYSEQKELHTDAPYRASILTNPANLRKALADAQADHNKILLGYAHGIPSTFVTKLIASRKPDFIWIDVEHGMFNRLELQDASTIHVAQHHSEGRSMVIVRIPKDDPLSITTALDAGAAGIIVPHCESAEEVERYKKEIYYPPMGHRSFSPWTFTPGLTTSLYPNDPFSVANSNNHICLIPQIESVKGIENAEAIAAVPGISALMFGIGDFMIDAGIDLSKGLGGEPDPVLNDSLGKFGAAAAKNNLPIFGGAMSVDMIPMLIQSGYRAIAVQFDVWGFTKMVDAALVSGRQYAKEFAEKNGKGVPNGQGKPE
ncbi:macrophomate synthase [Phaeosphaeria sp. MPI-PUGE-AT-0046c]|nr:macrophomate synthase [Phaeosphaeria sp. MPI-PUGE-AT-0046c]